MGMELKLEMGMGNYFGHIGNSDSNMDFSLLHIDPQGDSSR